MSEYYKSLISDDDVIKELLKESKRREGKSDTARLKPNLNFFQRTVHNLVSNNNRIDKGVDTFRSDYLKDANIQKSRVPVNKSTSTKMPLVDYAFERRVVLETKAKCLKPKRNKRQKYGTTKRKCEPHKLSFGSDVEDTTDICNVTSLDRNQRQSYKQALAKIDLLSTDSDSDNLEVNGNVKKASQLISGKSVERSGKTEGKACHVIVLSSDENEDKSLEILKNKKRKKLRKEKFTSQKNPSDSSTDSDV